jgi:coenzyme F420 hydrogenase subunit beta
MQTVAPGYSRPTVIGPVSAEAERRIASACPGAVVEPWPDTEMRHPYWGPLRRVAVGYATNHDIRFKASSGGAITALALHAMRIGLVDRIVHVAADPEWPTRNVVLCSSDPAEVIAGAGSRYASSSPLRDIDRLLRDGGRFAFVGKPCDVSALRRLGRIDDRVGACVPIMLSFFCAGVPSHDGADRVLAAMGVEAAEVERFRYRGNGWPGMASATTHDGRVFEMSYADSWGGHLSKEVQFRCKICPDGVGGAADVACADAWHGDEDGYPSFEEQDGRSLILARTDAGERLLKLAIEGGDLITEPADVNEIDGMQPSQARRKRLVLARALALNATLQPKPRMDGLMVRDAARRASMAEGVKNTLGTVRRIVQGRR